MIRAYDKKYLNDAMLNLGEAFDFAANVCQVELDNFLSMMISTGIAFPFERGVPKYVSGMSGTELALEILQKSEVLVENPAARTEYSSSPEYWTSWITACFQWDTGRSFQNIRESLSMREILRLYPIPHEVSEDRAIDTLNRTIRGKSLLARLQHPA